MLTNAALAVSIENLNGLPDENDLEGDENRLVARQNKVRKCSVCSVFI